MAGWRKALTWAGAIAFAYVGSRLPLPGLNVERLAELFSQPDGHGGLLGLYELVFQGGLHRGAILALGIMPYLSARLYMRLWRAVNPKAEPPRRGTRLFTLALSVIQSLGVATFLQRMPGVVTAPGAGFIATTVLTLTAGSLVAMWFGEQLTESNEPDLDDEVSALPERPSDAPALLAPELPVPPLVHPRPSSGAETLRTRR